MSGRQNGASHREILRSFFEGMTRPNVMSASIMLSVVLISFLAYIALVNDKLLAGDAYRFVMDKDLDTQTYATHQLLAAKRTDAPAVLIFGSSVMVRCVKDRGTVSDLVSSASGQSVSVYNLSTDAQTSWEFEAMVDRFPEDGSGVVVLGASYGFWTYSREHLEELINAPKLGFPTPTIDAAARDQGIKVPIRTGIYGLDASKYFLARRNTVLKNLLTGGHTYADPMDAYWMDIVNNPEFWAREMNQLPDYVSGVDANLEMNLEAVARAIENLRAKGDYQIIMFEAPINPGWFELEEGRAFFTDLQQALKEFTAEQAIEFASARDLIEFGAEDFVDYEGHISNDAARMACTQAVADLAAEALTR
jgi:hypothetical protein